MINIERNYVKDVTTPIYGCSEIKSKNTGEHTRQITISFYDQLYNLTGEVGMGDGELCRQSPLPWMNALGYYFKKSVTAYKLDQKFENIWKKTPLHHHEKYLGLNTVESQYIYIYYIYIYIIYISSGIHTHTYTHKNIYTYIIYILYPRIFVNLLG